MNGAFRHSISLVPQQPEDITNFTCIAWLVTFSSPFWALQLFPVIFILNKLSSGTKWGRGWQVYCWQVLAEEIIRLWLVYITHECSRWCLCWWQWCCLSKVRCNYCGSLALKCKNPFCNPLQSIKPFASLILQFAQKRCWTIGEWRPVTGLPSPPLVSSGELSSSRDSYLLAWHTTSFTDILQYQVLYRRLPVSTFIFTTILLIYACFGNKWIFICLLSRAYLHFVQWNV